MANLNYLNFSLCFGARVYIPEIMLGVWHCHAPIVRYRKNKVFLKCRNRISGCDIMILNLNESYFSWPFGRFIPVLYKRKDMSDVTPPI